MEKIKITLRPIRNSKIELNENEIEFTPYINTQQRYLLMADFIETLFLDDDVVRNYTVAKNSLILGIIDFVSNIDVSSVSLDMIIGSGLWDRMSKEIKNYESFMAEIAEAVKYYRDSKESFAPMIEKAGALIEKISSVDLSQEGVSDLLKLVDEKINETKIITDPSKAKPRTKKSVVQ